jgi:hypothetical protein
MSSLEFTEWMAHATLEPFGADRDDVRIAIMTAAIVNEVRALTISWTGNKQEPAKVEDYMPEFGKVDQEQEATDQAEAKQVALIAKIHALSAAGLGGKITRVNGA